MVCWRYQTPPDWPGPEQLMAPSSSRPSDHIAVQKRPKSISTRPSSPGLFTERAFVKRARSKLQEIRALVPAPRTTSDRLNVRLLWRYLLVSVIVPPPELRRWMLQSFRSGDRATEPGAAATDVPDVVRSLGQL